MKIAVLGGGAAGLFFGANAKGHNITIFDHMSKCGNKLLLTGGGRCNLTNLCEPAQFLQSVPKGSKFLQSAIFGFDSQSLCEWFSNHGLNTVVENGRVFPKTQNSQDVLRVLLDACHANGVNFVLGKDVGIEKQNDKFIIGGEVFDAIVFATGGKSFSATGSDGSGNTILQKFGLKTVEFQPKLCPIFANGTKELQGISLHANLKILTDNCEVAKSSGGLMFTHFGFSGPAALDACTDTLPQMLADVTVVIDVVPQRNEDELVELFLKNKMEHPQKKILSVVSFFVPQRLANFALKKSGLQNLCISGTKDVQIKKLAHTLKNLNFKFQRFGGFDMAWVCSGGVLTDQIDPKTMQAKNIPGLFVIGEALDVYGLCGGFNLQIAFSTAFAAANAVCSGILPN